MPNQNKITISFSREYQDVYEFLINQINVSNYICKKIRECIYQNTSTGNISLKNDTLGKTNLNSGTQDDLVNTMDIYEL